MDVIVTTGPPHSVHLIGQKLHKALGTPWIPDFRDPWSRMYYLKYLPMTSGTWRKLRAMEQAVLDECTTVLTCTPLVQEEFQAQTSTPVACITNGFDEEDFAGPAPKPDGRFNITHTGLFAADGNPFVLWKVLGEMASGDSAFREALRLRLVGKVDREVLEAMKAAGLEKAIVALGPQDHAFASNAPPPCSSFPSETIPSTVLSCPGSSSSTWRPEGLFWELARQTAPWPACFQKPAPGLPPNGTMPLPSVPSSRRPGASTAREGFLSPPGLSTLIPAAPPLTPWPHCWTRFPYRAPGAWRKPWGFPWGLSA